MSSTAGVNDAFVAMVYYPRGMAFIVGDVIIIITIITIPCLHVHLRTNIVCVSFAWSAATSGENEVCLKVLLVLAVFAVARFFTRNIYACICGAHYFK